MRSVEALIITGYGINCEKEMALACKKGGAAATIAHANELISGAVDLQRYQLLCFPGGFSFADELGAGKAFANRLTYGNARQGATLKEKLFDFVQEGKCIIGICNGFQLLVKLGLLPSFNKKDAEQTLSLAHNDSQKFEARWIHHKALPSPSVFTKGIDRLYLPVRHAEGKLVAREKRQVEALFDNRQVALQYCQSDGSAAIDYPCNPNGSMESIAALCDESGRIFGMMAHPEAALYFTNHPHWHRLREEAKRRGEAVPEEGDGLKIFMNGIDYLRSNL